MYLEYWPDTASAMHRQTVLLHPSPFPVVPRPKASTTPLALAGHKGMHR